jgi:hypothetical protein
VCVTLNYTLGSYNGFTTFTVENYQVKWTNLDSQVSISNGSLGTKVLGTDTGGTQWGTVQTFNVTYPSSGVTYTFTPSWAGHALKEVAPWYTYGWASAQLHRGGSTWTLTSPYVCAPNSTGVPYSPC